MEIINDKLKEKVNLIDLVSSFDTNDMLKENTKCIGNLIEAVDKIKIKNIENVDVRSLRLSILMTMGTTILLNIIRLVATNINADIAELFEGCVKEMNEVIRKEKK